MARTLVGLVMLVVASPVARSFDLDEYRQRYLHQRPLMAERARSAPERDPNLAERVDPILRIEAYPPPAEQDSAMGLVLQAVAGYVDRPDGASWAARQLLSSEKPFPVDPPHAARLERWLDNNAAALAMLKRVTRRGELQWLALYGTDDASGPPMPPIRALAHAQLVEARRLAGQGRPDVAAACVLEAAQLGRMIRQHAQTAITHLVGNAILAAALNEAHWLAGHADLAPKVRRSLLDGLIKQAPTVEPLVAVVQRHFWRFFAWDLRAYDRQCREQSSAKLLDVFQHERLWTLDDELDHDQRKAMHARLAAALDAVAARTDVDLVDYERTFDAAAAHYAAALGDMTSPWPPRHDLAARRKQIADDAQRRLRSIARQYARATQDRTDLSREAAAALVPLADNVLGDGCLAMLSTRLGKLDILDRRTRVQHSAAVTMVALQRYEARHGRLPDALSALVEDGVLEEVPADPFGDGPLRYNRSRRLIWSVEVNARDDGGRGAEAPADRFGKDSPDAVWPVPEPR